MRLPWAHLLGFSSRLSAGLSSPQFRLGAGPGPRLPLPPRRLPLASEWLAWQHPDMVLATQPSPLPRRFLPVAAAVVSVLGVLAPGGCDCEADPITEIVCDFEVRARDGNRVDFGQVEINGGTRSSAFVIENTGNQPLSQISVNFSQNAEHYSVDIPDGFVVAPTEDENLLAVFAPTARTILNAELRITHPDLGANGCPVRTLTLLGEGVAPPPVDAGFPDAGFPDDGGFFVDGGVEDGGFIDGPDGGIILGPNAEWVAYGGLEEARAGFALVELLDGTLLAVGGYGENGVVLDTIERFDPIAGRSRIVATMARGRAEPGAVLLDNGLVAIVGGRDNAVGGVVVNTLELYQPNDDTLSCPGTQATAGLCSDNSLGFLEGRINPIVTNLGTNEIAIGLGKVLDDDVEVGAPDMEILNVATGVVTVINGLPARTDEARVVDLDGSFVAIGGRAINGSTTDSILIFNAGSRIAGPHSITLPASRALAGTATLEDGSIMIVGGDAGAGGVFGDALIFTGAFGDTPTIVPTTLVLPPRVAPQVNRLPGDIVVVAGGLPFLERTLNNSVPPLTSADIIVPFGASFARFAADNDLAEGRVGGAAVTTRDLDDVVTYLGGYAVQPRRTPHPHAEQYLLEDNAFLSFGLMGAGTAVVAAALPSSGAAVVTVGGTDPHTNATSARSRAFDAENGLFTEASPLQTPRRDHSATSIAADLVVIIGGRDATGAVVGTASILDVDGADRPLPVSLRRPRAEHTATLLPEDAGLGDNTILVCGGVGVGGEPLDTCEIFTAPTNPRDPNTFATASFATVTGRLSTGRVRHSATLIDNGEVLLVGGGDIENAAVAADLFQPSPEARIVASGIPVRARRDHAAVHLGAGRVLVAGGEVFDGALAPSQTAEVYIRGEQRFVAVEDMEQARLKPAGFLLADGNVLLSGGTRNLGEAGFPTVSVIESEMYVAGTTGIGTFEAVDVPVSYGRSDLVQVDVFGRAILVCGTHRDGIGAGGAERRTPQHMVDMLEER